MMTQQQWLKRYQAEWRRLMPQLPASYFTEADLAQTYTEHHERFPEGPEAAAQFVRHRWQAEGRQMREQVNDVAPSD